MSKLQGIFKVMTTTSPFSPLRVLGTLSQSTNLRRRWHFIPAGSRARAYETLDTIVKLIISFEK
nr:hypothetical protein Iba_chr07aCG2050 [Ipomoea batatas]